MDASILSSPWRTPNHACVSDVAPTVRSTMPQCRLFSRRPFLQHPAPMRQMQMVPPRSICFAMALLGNPSHPARRCHGKLCSDRGGGRMFFTRELAANPNQLIPRIEQCILQETVAAIRGVLKIAPHLI